MYQGAGGICHLSQDLRDRGRCISEFKASLVYRGSFRSVTSLRPASSRLNQILFLPQLASPPQVESSNLGKSTVCHGCSFLQEVTTYLAAWACCPKELLTKQQDPGIVEDVFSLLRLYKLRLISKHQPWLESFVLAYYFSSCLSMQTPSFLSGIQ